MGKKKKKVHWTLSTEEDCDQIKLEPRPKDKSAEEIPQYTIKTAVISDKYSKAQLRK
jgi:hypothetical protein